MKTFAFFNTSHGGEIEEVLVAKADTMEDALAIVSQTTSTQRQVVLTGFQKMVSASGATGLSNTCGDFSWALAKATSISVN
jgi:hypothetical protein